MVDAVQDEELLIGLHKFQAGVQERLVDVSGYRALAQELDRLVDETVHALVQGDQDVRLAGEVVVEGGLGETHTFGELAQGRVVEALFDEQVQRLVQDPLPRAALTHQDKLT